MLCHPSKAAGGRADSKARGQGEAHVWGRKAGTVSRSAFAVSRAVHGEEDACPSILWALPICKVFEAAHAVFQEAVLESSGHLARRQLGHGDVAVLGVQLPAQAHKVAVASLDAELRLLVLRVRRLCESPPPDGPASERDGSEHDRSGAWEHVQGEGEGEGHGHGAIRSWHDSREALPHSQRLAATRAPNGRTLFALSRLRRPPRASVLDCLSRLLLFSS